MYGFTRVRGRQPFLMRICRRFRSLVAFSGLLIYDNLTSAVEKVLKGKDRMEQESFRKFHGYYNFTARFCNVDSGHEKGGVEGLVGFARRNYMVPIPRAESLEELNEQILRSCLEVRKSSDRGPRKKRR